MSENTMTQFKTEGQPAFPVANTENDNSAHSSGESKETNAAQTGSSDQDQNQTQQTGGEPGSRDNESGLNNPPVERWQEREADWKNRFNEQETRHATEMEKLQVGMNTAIGSAVSEALKRAGVQPEASADIPDWFGSDDNKLWGSYQSHTEKIVARAVEQALSQFTQRGDKEQKAIDEATTFFQNEVTAIEADKGLNPNGLKVDRNKLLKTALDNKVVDTDGRWNYRLAFKLMKPEEVFQAKAAINDRKQIAGATTEGNRAETKGSDVVSSKDFQNPANRPW